MLRGGHEDGKRSRRRALLPLSLFAEGGRRVEYIRGPLIASKLRRPVCAHLHRSLVSQTSARADAH